MSCAQDVDRDAYQKLLTEIEPYIRSIAVGHLSRSWDMEDAVQDALMTVIPYSRPMIRDDLSGRGWSPSPSTNHRPASENDEALEARVGIVGRA